MNVVKQPDSVQPPSGKLGILLPGLGAVATTMIAGVMLARRSLAQPIGSLTQLGTIRLGRRTDARTPYVKDFLPLAKLDDLVFGAWDIFPDNAYAWACMKEGVPFANGAPNLAVDFGAAMELAKRMRVPIAGKDFKTGQTLMKTVVAPMLKARMLGIRGWFSTNILGNRDGEVLDDPGSFKSKEATKLGVLDYILQPDTYKSLHGNLFHKVRIEYYPPRGDAKEGWDNIDLFGWCGYPMQMKIDFLCRDSILAAPIVLDLALLLDFAKRAGFSGIQEWLSFYFKCPMTAPNLYPEHDLFIQLMKLKNTMRWAMGHQTITHLGHEYYD